MISNYRSSGSKGIKSLISIFIVVTMLILALNVYVQVWINNINETIYSEQQHVHEIKIAKYEPSNITYSEEDIEEHKVSLENALEAYSKYYNISFYILIGSPILIGLWTLFIGLAMVKRMRINASALEESVAMAEKANEAKSVFLANMSHEIRTPLNAIIGFADILKDSVSEVKNKEYADIIHRSANTLLSIINDILDLSKIESGKIILESRTFNLHDLIIQIVNLYTIRAETKGLKMIHVIDTGVPIMIVGDALRLQQVISNLLANAIKFTPEGGTITLSLVLHDDYEDRVFVEFSVKDTGIGIPMDAQEKIFKPFSQADGGVTRNFGGTGLGLTISQKILNAMQSKLELVSFPRQGSTFSFKVYLDKDMSYLNDGVYGLEKKPIIGLYPPKIAKHVIYERFTHMVESFSECDYIANIDGVKQYDVICLFSHSNAMEDYHLIRLYDQRVPVIFIGERSYIEEEEERYFYAFYKNPIMEEHFKTTILEIIEEKGPNNKKSDILFKGEVLVAEDNTTNRLLIQIILERLGLTVDFARDGYEAIAKVKNKAYDMIFMDIHMPKKDGVAATKEVLLVEQDLNRLHTPIIALTANALKGDRERYINAGMDDYISKPIMEQEVIRVLKTYGIEQVTDEKVMNNRIHDQQETKEEIDLEELFQQQMRRGSSVEGKTAVLEVSEEVDKEITVEKVTVNQEKLYDVNKAAAKVGLDVDTLSMLLDNFFLTFEKDFGKLRTAVEGMDQNEIIEAAHYLKGSALNLYFEKGGEMFKEVERYARDGQLEWIQLDVIANHFKEIENSLRS